MSGAGAALAGFVGQLSAACANKPVKFAARNVKPGLMQGAKLASMPLIRGWAEHGPDINGRVIGKARR
jgi:hypothetical protein